MLGSRWILAVACVAALLAAPGGARAATFTVGSTADDDSGAGACATSADLCTLRTAVEKANASAGPDTIELPAGTFVLSKPGADEDGSATGDLDVAESLTIAGAGSGTTFIDGGALDRVFDVLDPSAELALTGLTVSDGNVTGGVGGIRSLGPSLRLTDVVLTGITGASAIDLGPPGAGSIVLSDAAIRANLTTRKLIDLHPGGPATLTLTRSTVQSNTVAATSGLPAIVDIDPSVAQASVSIDHSTFASNVLGATSGSEGLLDVAPTGSATGTPTTVSVADSVFSHNALGDDGAGAVHVAPSAGGATATVTRVIFDANTAGAAGAGRGGAIAFQPTGGGPQALTVTDSSFTNNVAGSAGAGQGGAIDFSGGAGAALAITGSTFAFNRAGPVDGTQGARGGAMAVGAGAALTVVNSTFSENAAAAPAGSGDGGGALWLAGDSAALTNVTIAGNTVGAQGHGGGIQRAAGGGPVTVRNSIVANECSGAITTGGHNLESGTTCGFTGELQADDPLLAPLADNGGPTPTRMPDPTSRAIDAGDPAACPATDQRGVARPQGRACDIGAVEAPAASVVVTTPPPGTVIKAAPEPRPRVRAIDVIGLPSAKRCVKHVRFVVRIRRPRGMTLTAVRVFVNGARVRLLRGRHIKSSITLSRVPQGRFEIRVTVLTGTSSAVSLSRTQRYRTCARKLRRG